MNWDWLILLLLGIWALLFGIFSVTNIKIEGQTVVMGVAALVLGVVCLIRAIAGSGAWRGPPNP